MVLLYHATKRSAAASIERERRFRRGSRGYAGAGIYFSDKEDSAIYHCFNGRLGAEVIIVCEVDVGNSLLAGKGVADKAMCTSQGCDSVRVAGTDTICVYDPSRIQIRTFRDVHTRRSYASMNDLCQAHCFPQASSQAARFSRIRVMPVSESAGQWAASGRAAGYGVGASIGLVLGAACGSIVGSVIGWGGNVSPCASRPEKDKSAANNTDSDKQSTLIDEEIDNAAERIGDAARDGAKYGGQITGCVIAVPGYLIGGLIGGVVGAFSSSPKEKGND